MICKSCGSEFDIENFDVCPYCLSPVHIAEELIEQVKGAEQEPFDGGTMNNSAFLECEKSETVEIVENSVPSGADVTDTVENVPSLGGGGLSETAIENFELSVRAYNVLKRNSINTMEELIRFASENSLYILKNAGVKTVEEIEELVTYYKEGKNVFKTINEEIEASVIFPFSKISSDFDKLSVLALPELGMSARIAHALVKHGWSVCGDLKNVSEALIEKVVRKASYSEVLAVAERLEKDIVSVLEKLLDDSVDKREGRIFIRRSKGDTLQYIADNPDDKCESTLTRERVRQIERKFGIRLLPFVRVLVDLLVGESGYICVQDLLDVYSKDDYGRIIVHISKMLNEYEYLDFADMFVKRKEGLDIEQKLVSLLVEFVGDGIDLYDNIEKLDELLTENGFSYIGIDAVENLLKKERYHIYGDYVLKGKVSYGVLCVQVIKKHFPQGIKLSQNDVDREEDMIKLRRLVKERYIGIELPESDRALSSALTRCGLVLRGRGMYIPEELVEIDESVLAEIKEKIDNNAEDRVFYNELYSEFEGVLNFTCGIDNYNYLHGVLMRYYPFDYEYSRDYLLKKGATEDSAGTFADRINKFICEVGRPVKKEELMQKFRGFSDIMIAMPFINDKRLLQWEYNCYSCMDIISITQSDRDTLQVLLQKLLNENNGYTSEALLYRCVKNNYPSILEKNNMTSGLNLFYVASKLFGDTYDFRKPHISTKGKFDKFSTKDVALHLMGYPDNISYESYRKVAERMGWPSVTAGLVFSEIEMDYVRVSDDEYVSKTLFSVPETVKSLVREKMSEIMEDGILPLYGICMDEFPEYKYPWNEFLIESIIKKAMDDIVIVQPTIKDRRYQRGIAVLKEKGLISYSQIVAYKMESYGFTSMKESQFLSFLLVHNLCRNMIPNELSNSDYVRKEGDTYICTT